MIAGVIEIRDISCTNRGITCPRRSIFAPASLLSFELFNYLICSPKNLLLILYQNCTISIIFVSQLYIPRTKWKCRGRQRFLFPFNTSIRIWWKLFRISTYLLYSTISGRQMWSLGTCNIFTLPKWREEKCFKFTKSSMEFRYTHLNRIAPASVCKDNAIWRTATRRIYQCGITDDSSIEITIFFRLPSQFVVIPGL